MATKFRTYKCHMVVQASKIVDIKYLRTDSGRFLSGWATLILCGRDGESFEEDVDSDWIDKYEPEVGGYFVICDDGDTSFVSREVFEKGYEPVDDK